MKSCWLERILSGQKKVNPELYHMQWESMQKSIGEQMKILREVNPDVVVIIGDDQGELYFEDNMPKFSVYWGDTMPIIPQGA